MPSLFPRNRSVWLPVLFSALLGIVIYASTLRGTFIYDDIPVAQMDKRLDNVALWKFFWTRDYYYDVDQGDGSIDNLYRPLVSMSFALQVLIHGKNPLPLHLVNILLYGGCCALVSLLGHRVGAACCSPSGTGRVGKDSLPAGDPSVRSEGLAIAWIAGLLFAAHPVHVESVAALVGRAELMAMLGIVGALCIHLAGELTFGRALGITACMVVALLSKEQGMLMPGLLLLAEPLRRQIVWSRASSVFLPGAETGAVPPLDYASRADAKPRITPGQLLMLCVCFLCGAYIVLREQILHLKFWWDRSFLDPAVQPMLWSHGLDRALMPLVLFGHYLHHLIFPNHLAFDYSGRAIGWTVSFSDPHLYLGALGVLAGVSSLLLALCLRAWRLVFLLGAFALTYGVIGNVVSLIGTNYGERLIFTPSVFFVLLVAVGLSKLPVKGWATVLAILVTAGSVHAGAYANRWNNRLEFYRWSMRHQPDAIRVYQVVFDELLKKGDLEGAYEVAAGGRKALPEYWDIWIQSSLAAEKLGRWEEAEAFMTEAAKLNPRLAALKVAEVRARRATTQAAATRPATTQSTK